jgi:DNA-3-methyladenine glycosylase I
MMTTSQQIASVRCTWAANELNIPYHDEEWGVPVHDEHKWFEFLTLEGAQAGLSWDTILKKRARYREVIDGFDPKKVARYDKKKVRELLRDAGIIRNRMKINATIANARDFWKCKRNSARSTPTCGALSAASQNKMRGKATNAFPQKRPNPTLSAKIFRSAASALLARRFATP